MTLPTYMRRLAQTKSEAKWIVKPYIEEGKEVFCGRRRVKEPLPNFGELLLEELVLGP